MNNYISIIIAIISSSVLSIIVNGIINRNKNVAEVENTKIDGLLRLDERTAERITKLEERVSTLEAENDKLRKLNSEAQERIIDLIAQKKLISDENEKK